MTSSLASPAFQQQIAFVTGEQLRQAVSPAAAVDALQAVLEAGLDPEHDSPRTRVATEGASSFRCLRPGKTPWELSY